MRFGRWDEILAEPEPPEYLPIVARAAALRARRRLRRARASTPRPRRAEGVPRGAREGRRRTPTFGNNTGDRRSSPSPSTCSTGEIAVPRRASSTRASPRCARRVAREDELRYDEPPDWIQPVRHALGAALLARRAAPPRPRRSTARTSRAARERLVALRPRRAPASCRRRTPRRPRCRSASSGRVEQGRRQDPVALPLPAGRVKAVRPPPLCATAAARPTARSSRPSTLRCPSVRTPCCRSWSCRRSCPCRRSPSRPAGPGASWSR